MNDLIKTGEYTAVNPNFQAPLNPRVAAINAQIAASPLASQGISQAPSAIPSASLSGNATPLPIPQAPTSTVAQAGAAISGAAEGSNASLSSIQQQTQDKITAAQKGLETEKTTYQKLIEKFTGKGQAQITAEEQAKIPELSQLNTDLVNEYNSKQQQYRRQEEELQKTFKGDPNGLQDALNKLSREKNSELADIAIRQSVASNNLTTAQNLVNRKIDLEYGDLKDLITFQKDFVNDAKDQLDKEDKRAFDLAIAENEREYKEGAEKIKLLENARIEIYKNLAANNAPSSVWQAVGGAKDINSLYANAGSFAGDVLERQIKQNNLYKSQLEIQKLKKDLEPGTGGDAPLYNGLSTATATAVRGIVSGFKSEPQLTNFATIQDGYNFTQQISDKTKNPADDQALIYSLAKALDPGSVVREGEYATAQKYAQSWIKAYGKGVEQAVAGTGFLSEEARKNIKKVIETKYNSSKVSYDNLYGQYSKQINNLTGRDDGAKFLRDYAVNTSRGGVMRSPDGTQEVNVSDLTPEQIEEAKKAGWQ